VTVIAPDKKTQEALNAVLSERWRQYRKLTEKGIPTDCADPATPSSLKLAVLGEEFGEVCKALIEGTNVEDELIHVAAVATAWIESFRRPQ
jgi:hypothetical protein